MRIKVTAAVAAIVLGLAVLAGLTGPAAADLDSEHLFGLTEGSDIGTAGERELELEFAALWGKRSGEYHALSPIAALKLTITDDFRVSPFIGLEGHRIRSVPGIADRDQWAVAGGGLEFKYRALSRQQAPFGLTFAAIPYWGRVDGTGARVDAYGGVLAALADKELIANRLLAAVNLVYAPEGSRTRATGVWDRTSTFAASGALSVRLSDSVFLGGELRYEAAYNGLALDRFAGEGWFAGPSLYARLSPTAWVSVLWNAQIAGHASGDPRNLDLTNFERNLVKVRLGMQF